MSSQARVGLVSILAVVVVVGMLTVLRGGIALRRQGYELTIRFTDAAGVTVGTPVRMAGVGVGEIKTVTLSPDHQALMTVMIHAGVSIPQGSHFIVATTGFLGDRFISISPGRKDAPALAAGAVVQGDEPFTLEGLEKRFSDVADKVERLVDNLNRIAGDPEVQDSLRQVLRNANEVTLIVRQAALTVEQTTRHVQRLVDSDVVVMVSDLRRVSRNMLETSAQLQAFVDATVADGSVAKDVRETAASLRDASERIARMAADLQGVVNQENVGKAREMVENARETVREAQTVVHRANAIVERVDHLVPAELRAPDLRLDYEVWYAAQHAGHGIDVTLFPEAGRFYRLGLHDIGATNGFVLQVGQRLDAGLAWRAGVFESQIGLGLDYRLAEPLWLNLDLYNPNQLTLDVLGRYQVAPNWRIALGEKNLLRQPTVFFGIGFNY